VGLEQGTHRLVRKFEEIFERKTNDSGLEIRQYGRRDPSRWPRGTLYPQKLTLASLTSGGSSVGIVGSRIQVTEFFESWKQKFCAEMKQPSPRSSQAEPNSGLFGDSALYE
jgi:hypothetical protein